MIANIVGQLTLPEPTISDEILGRVYYALSSGIDTVQTVAKVARSVFATALAFLFLGQSTALNATAKLSWGDVGFSIQMLGCSLLGILSPRIAWVKKCDLHICNVIDSCSVDFSGLLMEEWNQSKSFAMRCFLVGQLGESVLRYITSGIRYIAAKAMVGLSLGNAKFVDLLGDGANHSTNTANTEISLISEAVFRS